MPKNRRRRIAIAGAGKIVVGAHLPAYALAGFEVAGIWNRTANRARAAAAQFSIPRVYRTIDELLDDDSVDIVDIALIPEIQVEVVRGAAAAGKHVLCQKPLHEEVAPAQAMVEACEAAGVWINVNQQLRHDGRMRAVGDLFARGLLGQPTRTVFDINVDNPFDLPWHPGERHLEIMYHSIHYLDALRSLFGEPWRVFSSAGRLPDQSRGGETRSTTVLEFDAGHTALVNASANNRRDIEYATFRFEGTRGTVTGDLDLFSGNAAGDATKLMIRCESLGTDDPYCAHIPELRVPDSFIGPMASLMVAIEDGIEPDPGGRDNLRTIALLEACYRSADSGQAVTIPNP